MYALDTNAVIHAFQGKGKVAHRLAAVPPDLIAIPSIVLYEAEQGVLRSNNPAKRRQQLSELVRVCQVIPFDEKAAGMASKLRVDLQRRGIQIGELDTLIAATTLASGLVLVTHNTREFARVPGLQLEDWFD